MQAHSSAEKLNKIVAHCKTYGFVFPSSEIYEGLGGVFDYGPYGVLLKNALKEFWWRSMTGLHAEIHPLDSSIFMRPETWQASGHLDAFNDPLIDNRDSKNRYRADTLIEDHLSKLRKKVDKQRQKLQDRSKSDSKRNQHDDPSIRRWEEQISQISERLTDALKQEDMNALKSIIDDAGIVDPQTGSKNWTQVRKFNLMFGTRVGSVEESAREIYLRPETAQGIFVNFLNVSKTCRTKIPFGIAQVGKAFRNEIIIRQFIFRMREFEQMEMQYFVAPPDASAYYEYWKDRRLAWHRVLFDEPSLRWKPHTHLAHYALAAGDIEFDFPMGFKELEGIHSRGDFDLRAHEKKSGKKLRYFDPKTGESLIPMVVETSLGLDRLFLAVLEKALATQTLEDGSCRDLLSLDPVLAPVKAAFLPLVDRDGLADLAERLHAESKLHFHCALDVKDSIGKRYRRQDAIGTPFCITVDSQTLQDETITIRSRDDMQQSRIPATEVTRRVRELTEMHQLLSKVTESMPTSFGAS